MRCAAAEAAVHLDYQQQTKPAPLKGLEQPLNAPGTIGWNYVTLRMVMKGPDEFDWSFLEGRLNRAAAVGKMLVLRPVMDLYGDSSGPVFTEAPLYLTELPGATVTVSQANRFYGQRLGTVLPVYTNVFTRMAIMNFIRAFGKKYDGDPRVAFIEVGLLGAWGEWHDINSRRSPETTVPPEMKRAMMQAYKEHFKNTKLLTRWPDKEIEDFPTGYHDDWFAFWKRPDTLYQKQTNAGPVALMRWQTEPMGARLHPEFDMPEKLPSLTASSITPTRLSELIEQGHISWLRYRHNKRELPSGLLVDLETVAPKMGYEFYIPHADWEWRQREQIVHLSLTVTNTAVAPFYYPWQVEIGLWHDHKLQQTWPVDWDIRRIIPGQEAITYTATLKEFPRRLRDARLMMRVVNPLPSGFPLRFANKTQDVDLDGWLTLGPLNR
ncbi:MAG TPA: DUF4832 domain-containing protein [Verrucomicrobiae bacterium]